MSVVDTLAVLKGSDLTDTEYFRAAVLGWCIELVSLGSSHHLHN
jgi:farnesyl diphosphate synthase